MTLPTMRLSKKIWKRFKQEELCPVCFGELEIKTFFEVVGEYMGRPAEQEVTRRVCKHCGNKF